MIIKMNFEMMAEMKKSCQLASEQLDETLNDVNHIAELLAGGGLIGDGGTAYVEALRDVLAPKVTTLRDKFEELQRDLQNAVNLMGGAEAETQRDMGK